MLSPFIIPEIQNPREIYVEDLWGDCSATGLIFFNYWSKISLGIVEDFQRGSYENCLDDEDIDFSKNLTRDSVAKFLNDNVALLVKQINNVAERLAEAEALPRYTPLQVLTGFTKYSVPEFVGPFDQLLNVERLCKLESSSDPHDSSKFLTVVKKLTFLASNYFHSMNSGSKWNIPRSRLHSMAKATITCDNCGRPHYAPDCPLPLDEARIQRAKDSRVDKGNRGRGGGYDIGCGYYRGRGGHGVLDGCKKWENGNKAYTGSKGNGVELRGNIWMCDCRRKGCGLQSQHVNHACWPDLRKGHQMSIRSRLC